MKMERSRQKLCLTGRAMWINFKPDAAVAGVAPVAAIDVTSSAPRVIEFDEVTGRALNAQVEIIARQDKTTIEPQQLPWREWFSGAGSSLGDVEADHAAAVAVLHAVHRGMVMEDQPINIVQLGRVVSVITTRTVNRNTIMIPPVVPKQSKVHGTSVHPCAAQIPVHVIRPTGAGEPSPEDQTAVRTRRVFVHPEFVMPNDATNKPPGRAACGDEKWAWDPKGGEAMCPYWAVRRMTRSQL